MSGHSSRRSWPAKRHIRAHEALLFRSSGLGVALHEPRKWLGNAGFRHDLCRASRARLPARKAAHHARRLPALAERPAPGLQPVHQPRSGRGLRRGRAPRRAPPLGAPGADAPDQRRRQPRRQAPAPARRGAAHGRGRTGGHVRADAARRPDARRAQATQRADARLPRARRGARDAAEPDRARAGATARAQARPEGGALPAAAAGRGRRGGGGEGAGAGGTPGHAGRARGAGGATRAGGAVRTGRAERAVAAGRGSTRAAGAGRAPGARGRRPAPRAPGACGGAARMSAHAALILASASDTATGVGIPLALAAGLVSFLSPCVLPLVPGYLSTVIGVTPADLKDGVGARRVLVPSLLFIASFSAIFILLSMSATVIGSSLNTHKQALEQAGGVLIILMGLVFLATPFVAMLNREWHSEGLLRLAGRGGPIVAAGQAQQPLRVPLAVEHRHE